MQKRSTNNTKHSTYKYTYFGGENRIVRKANKLHRPELTTPNLQRP